MGKRISTKKYLPIIAPGILLTDLFLIEKSYLGVQILIGLLWVFIIFTFKLRSNASFYIFFIFVLIWITLSYLEIQEFSDKINIFAYYALVVGLVQLILENRKG
jgi:hypothetical protein